MILNRFQFGKVPDKGRLKEADNHALLNVVTRLLNVVTKN